MGRKKKEGRIVTDGENKYVIHPELAYPDLTPEMIDITSLSDHYRQYIEARPYTITTTGTGVYDKSYTHHYPSLTKTPEEWGISWEEVMKMEGREEETKVNIISRELDGEHMVMCDTVLDLLPEKILTTLSAAKGKLMFSVAPIHIKEIRCKMTPDVRNNIIEASKRLRMYGKKSPIIPSFDEYGNRLPDQIEIGGNKGITVEIVDPQDYGRLYFELRAIEFRTTEYNPSDWGTIYTWWEDTPF